MSHGPKMCERQRPNNNFIKKHNLPVPPFPPPKKKHSQIIHMAREPGIDRLSRTVPLQQSQSREREREREREEQRGRKNECASRCACAFVRTCVCVRVCISRCCFVLHAGVVSSPPPPSVVPPFPHLQNLQVAYLCGGQSRPHGCLLVTMASFCFCFPLLLLSYCVFIYWHFFILH